MRTMKGTFLVIAALLLAAGPVLADKYSDTVSLFKNAGQQVAATQSSREIGAMPSM